MTYQLVPVSLEQDTGNITVEDLNYRKVSNIRGTKSQNSNASRLDLQLPLRNILKPGVKWKMKM